MPGVPCYDVRGPAPTTPALRSHGLRRGGRKGVGKGRSKKDAEQAAALVAWQEISGA